MDYKLSWAVLILCAVALGCGKSDAVSSSRNASDEDLIRATAKADGRDEAKDLDYYRRLQVADPGAYEHAIKQKRSVIAMSGWNIDEYADKTLAARNAEKDKAAKMEALYKTQDAERGSLKIEWDAKVAAAEKNWNDIGTRGSAADLAAAEKKWDEIKAQRDAALKALDERHESQRKAASVP